MSKLVSLVFVLVISCAVSAHAMPVAALAPVQTELTIPVVSGCGLGVRRGAFNGCDAVYVYVGYGGYRPDYYQGCRRGYYRGYRHANYPYVRYNNVTGVVAVNKGVCRFGSYLSCVYGTCWRRCY